MLDQLDDIQCLLEQFKSFYDNKLTSAENDDTLSKEEILEMKLDISRAYISDLAEQNLNLIQTSLSLRNETENRVKILDKLVGKTTEYLRGINDDQHQHHIVDKNVDVVLAKLKTVEKERNILREHGAYLGRQVSALIHVITRARNTGCWDFSGTELYSQELDGSPEKCSKSHLDDFNCTDSLVSCCEEFENCWTDNSNKLYRRSPSILSLSFQEPRLTDRDVLIKRLQVDVKFLEKEQNAKNLQLLAKDGTIAALQSQIIALRHELSLKENDCALHTRTLQRKVEELTSVERLRTREKSKRLEIEFAGVDDIQLTNASAQTDNIPRERMESSGIRERVDELREKDEEIAQLSKEISQIKRDERNSLTTNEREKYALEILKLKDELHLADISAQETRLILTHEIAEKHDVIKNLREELAELNDHHKEIVQQLVLKSEVMKGLRKDLQLVETKLAENELEMTNQKVRFLTQCELMDVQANEIENQKITIANLQDALVQSKRANGNVINNANGTSAKKNPAVREIFDI